MDPEIAPLSLLVPGLIAGNAYFVATGFALLSARRSWVDPDGRDAERRTGPLVPSSGRLDELALVAQLGNSVCTVLLGYVLARLAVLALGGTGAVVMGVAVAVVVHALLGEQIPKLLGAQRATLVTRAAVLLPLRVISVPLRPLTWLLGGAADVLGRMVGISGSVLFPPVHTADEIRLLVMQGHEQGMVEEDEREMIHGVFEFSETVAREVMTPRIDMVAAPVDVSLDDLIRLVVTEGHSRVPVYEGSVDTVVGVVLAKDLIPLLWAADARGREAFDVRAVMRQPYFVPDTKPVDDILAEFRQQSVHLAVVLDEFGGTSGMVTMEDLLEEIVGDINDEYDVVEPEFFATPEGDVLIDGGASLSEVNERFGLRIPEEDYDTVGGYIFGVLGRVPAPGDMVGGLGDDQGLSLTVDELEDRRVVRVRLARVPAISEATGGED